MNEDDSRTLQEKLEALRPFLNEKQNVIAPASDPLYASVILHEHIFKHYVGLVEAKNNELYRSISTLINVEINQQVSQLISSLKEIRQQSSKDDAEYLRGLSERLFSEVFDPRARALADILTDPSLQISPPQPIHHAPAWKWVAPWLVTLLLGFGASIYFVHQKGIETGVAQSSEATTWGNSPQGRIAKKLLYDNPEGLLTQCNQEGWKVESKGGKKICRPSDGAGWWLP